MGIKCADVAAKIHADMCDDDSNGYSWSPRDGSDGKGKKTLTINGRRYSYDRGSYDCSSSVIKAWSLALTGTAYEGALDGATYTGNMRSVFEGSGLFYSSKADAKRGDVYLNDENHTAMCQDGGSDGVYGYDALSEFSINENGEVYGGKVGDQTGKEAWVHAFYDYPWGPTLHYNGKADSSGSTDASKTSGTTGGKKAEPRYRVMANWRWLDEMQGETDTGGSSDNYAGEKGVAIQYFACDASRYRVKTQASGWLPWVKRYDTGDLENGCAGDGSAILAIEIDDSTVKYRVHDKGGGWLAWMVGRKDTGGSSDTFAGDGKPIDLVRMRRA